MVINTGGAATKDAPTRTLWKRAVRAHNSRSHAMRVSSNLTGRTAGNAAYVVCNTGAERYHSRTPKQKSPRRAGLKKKNMNTFIFYQLSLPLSQHASFCSAQSRRAFSIRRHRIGHPCGQSRKDIFGYLLSLFNLNRVCNVSMARSVPCCIIVCCIQIIHRGLFCLVDATFKRQISVCCHTYPSVIFRLNDYCQSFSGAAHTNSFVWVLISFTYTLNITQAACVVNNYLIYFQLFFGPYMATKSGARNTAECPGTDKQHPRYEMRVSGVRSYRTSQHGKRCMPFFAQDNLQIGVAQDKSRAVLALQKAIKNRNL